MPDTIKSERDEWLDSLDLRDPVNLSVGDKTYKGVVIGFDSHWENRPVHEVRIGYSDDKGNDKEEIIPLYSGKIDQVSIDPYDY